jgi:hypothetical protein
LIKEGGKWDIDIDRQVRLDDRVFRVTFPDATVTIALADGGRERILSSCSSCNVPCEHIEAVFARILEEKLSLGRSIALLHRRAPRGPAPGGRRAVRGIGRGLTP